MRWILPEMNRETAAAAKALGAELNVPPFLGGLLARRGFRTPAAAQDFLRPKLNLLSDPFALPNMAAAAERILRAVAGGERIVLYGDYDVDGVTSLTILAGMLAAYGAAPACFLPMRVEEGYGLSAEGVARCVQEHRPQLLIAVDCGTASAKEINALQARGVDVIVFDHHEPQGELPACVALVNAKLGDTYHYLCSAGLVFKACHALLKRRPLPGFDLKEMLDLVALGTVADLVPLVDENRIFVRKGSVTLARTRRPGLCALMEVSAVKGSTVRPSDIGFRLGPRLNAAGRLGTAQAALELLQTGDEPRARALAAALNEQNRERQAVEAQTLAEAQAQLAALGDECFGGLAAIVVGARGWHPGVLGIVASRLMRQHHRPTLVVGFDERGVGKGSGRSIEGLSLVSALTSCAALLDKFGGHEMAAGLALQEAAFPSFQKNFCEIARALLSDEQLQPRLRLDAELTLAELDADFLACHDLLQPCGMGNPQPTFVARGIVPAGEPRVLKDKHLSFLFRQPPGGRGAAEGRFPPPTRAIYFSGVGQGPLPPPPWDVAFQVEANEWRGETNLQMQVQAIRAAVN